MKTLLLLLISLAAFGQSRDTYPRYFPGYTVAALPSVAAGYVAVVTDASTAGSCTSGGGSALALCRYSGSAWQSLGGASGGAVDSVTAGATGAITCTPTTGSVVCDIVTAYVASKTGTNAWTGSNTFTTLGSATNCADSAGAAACGSASAGSVVIDAAATTVVVSTTAVTANSQIHVTFDESLGTRLGVTCNTTFAAPWVSARTAGASFTIKVGSGPVTNPGCFSYTIVN